jgi:hypothetical protein
MHFTLLMSEGAESSTTPSSSDGIEEDRILITENARDFRGLVGRTDMHPGLIILPSISRAGTLRLLDEVLHFLRTSRPSGLHVQPRPRGQRGY